MKPSDIVEALSLKIDNKLASDLVHEFVQIKLDYATGTLGRSSAGKFIETVVQILQFLDSGVFQEKPDVDPYLKNLESKQTKFDDGLRICCSRIARASYTLRNKRNILHKGDVDPNIFDLKHSFHAAQWILTELVRHVTAESMRACGNLITFIQLPIHEIVEEIDNKKVVHGNFSIEEEALVLLHSYYPSSATRAEIGKAMERRSSGSVTNSLNKLWREKFVQKLNDRSVKLTAPGFNRAQELIAKSIGSTELGESN